MNRRTTAQEPGQDPWEGFASAHTWISSQHGWWHLIPQPIDAPAPADGAARLGLDSPCHVLTAYNPAGRAAAGVHNRAAARGYEQLALKAVVDGFAAIAFAATFGIGAMASALAILAVQGSLTVLGAILGGFLPVTHIHAMTATGGLLLVGVALRLLRIRELRVADLLPALLVAPLLTEIVARLR